MANDGESALAQSKSTTQITETHIMISYDHKHQYQVLALNIALEKMGYNTWIDEEKSKPVVT